MTRILSLFVISMLFGVLAFAQTRVVTGKITDDKGNPIPNASIRVKGGRGGSSANNEGSFRVNVTNTASTFVVSATGYLAKEVAVAENLTIVLDRDTKKQDLTEVIVVTAGGIKKSEKTTGYAISKVDPGTILQKSEPDVLKGLQGKVAGVDIRSGQGTPGAATRIQIRGNSSFFGANQPLIIVDGVPYSNDQITSGGALTGGGAYGSGIANLDPNDIASMNILKGSSAGALYGSRASNGVIIITTKSGSVSRTKKGIEITVKSSFSFENISNLPTYQNSYGTGSQGVAGGGSNGSWGGFFKPNDSVPVWSSYGNAYPELFPTGKVPYKAYPNNVKDLFTTGLLKENSISLNTGDEKTSFSLTASQLNHSGYVANNTYNRTNISAGGSSKLDIGVNVRANFSYTRSKQDGGLFGENQVGSTSSQFGRAMFLGRSWPVDLPFEDKNNNPVSWVGTQADHPFWAAKYNKSSTIDERMVAGVHFDFNITKWARVDYNFGSNVSYLNRRDVQEVGSRGTPGRMILDNNRSQELESTLLFSFTPNTGADFTVKPTVGSSFNQRTSTRVQGTGGYVANGGGFITRGIYTLDNFLPTDRSISDGYSRRRLLGVFGELTLGYKNWAFVTVSGRNDISSTLPANNRSYFYPSISGSFIFSDALKIQGNILDYGKLRAGYAKVGRDAGPYNIFNTFALNTAFLGQPNGAVNPDANGGSALQPEFTKELELGAQLSFFKKRVEVDFTWYDKRSNNLLAGAQVPASTGYSTFYTNFGGLSNKGIEVDLTVRPVRTKNFTWEVKGIYTRNKNIVTALAPGLTLLSLGGGTAGGATNVFEVGKPFGYLQGSKVYRDPSSGALLIDPSTGAMIEDPTVAEIGDPNPLYKMGITNTLRYKGISLSTLFDMTVGGDLYSVTVSSLLGRGVTQDTKDRETGWVIPGVYGNAITGLPILSGGKTIPNQTRLTTNDLYFSPNGGSTFAINTADEWNVYDATVYRLRELTIGYDFPKAILKNSKISGVNFSISARNLWYYAPGFPKYTHFDPETGSYGASSVQGLEFSAAPTTRRIGVNLILTF
jgi:TonB-linked SusC/RagA family outer membrane protein